MCHFQTNTNLTADMLVICHLPRTKRRKYEMNGTVVNLFCHPVDIGMNDTSKSPPPPVPTTLQSAAVAQPPFSPYLFSHGGQAAMFSLAAFFIDAMRTTKNSITRPSIKLEVQHSQRSQNQIESFPNTFENTLPTISFGIQHGSPFSPLSLLNNCKKAQNHYVTKLIHIYPRVSVFNLSPLFQTLFTQILEQDFMKLV